MVLLGCYLGLVEILEEFFEGLVFEWLAVRVRDSILCVVAIRTDKLEVCFFVRAAILNCNDVVYG